MSAITLPVLMAPGDGCIMGGGPAVEPWGTVNCAKKFLFAISCVACACMAVMSLMAPGSCDGCTMGGGPIERHTPLAVEVWGKVNCDKKVLFANSCVVCCVSVPSPIELPLSLEVCAGSRPGVESPWVRSTRLGGKGALGRNGAADGPGCELRGRFAYWPASGPGGV